MKPSVLIFRTELLPYSETFILAQAGALRKFTPVFAGLRRLRRGILPDNTERLLLTDSGTLAQRIRRRIFLESGFAPAFLTAIRQRQPALVHAHFAVDAAAALPLMRKLDVPLVVTLHGYDVTTRPAVLQRSAAGRVFLRRRKELYERASVFLCVSDHLRRIAVERGFPAKKLRTLPIGVDLDLFAPDPLRSRSRDPILLFVGRLVEVKGCVHVIRAMRWVEQRHPEGKLIVVGDGPLLDSLRAEAGRTARQITFLGCQPPAVVRDLMHRAMLLAAPSVTTREGNSEALGLAACEAQAMGLPVVGFSGTGVEEAVSNGETGLLVKQGDERALADALCQVLDDPERAKQMGIAGRRRAEERYSLAAQTATLEDLYSELLA